MNRFATVAPCLLCGRMIFDGEVRNAPTWLNQFRILYSHRDVISITGVGYYRDGSFGCWIAPPDYETRWDHEGYDWPSYHRIGVLREPPVQGRWGLAFHEACWSLLEVAVAPSSVPLKRLFDLCRSFPIPNGEHAPNWGHYYGGLNEEHPDNGLSFEVNDQYTRHHRLCITQTAKRNPFHVPNLNRLCVASTEDTPQLGFTGVQTFDPFAFLPPELRMYIAALLPTRDVLAMRLASPLFTPMFHEQRFWATRFGPGSERSWVFESRGWDWSTDWRRLYRQTNLARRSQAMHNRERVWLLALYVKSLFAPRFANPESTMVPWCSDMHHWSTAAVDVHTWDAKAPYRDFSAGCVTHHESRRTPLPRFIDRISFYLSWIGEVQYVVGLRVVGTCGAVVELGYMAQEAAIQVCGKALTGLRLALSPTGIRAVRCVFEAGIEAPWIGSLTDASETTRLVSSGRLSAIFARFDGCRITSLSFAATKWKYPSLRDTAVWREGVPNQTLRLNEASFSVMYADDGLYDPVQRSVFGGTNGQSLRYLTGIHAYVTLTPCVLEFAFAPGHLDYLDTCQDLGVLSDSDMVELQRFRIDGPGGERINGVELYVRHDPNGSYLNNEANAALDSFKASFPWGFLCLYENMLMRWLGFYESGSVMSLSAYAKV
ncbi:hypothetical protein CCM_07098 [Cordyceps militaris CM01]|uniref:DUF7600 domain-containing protein n=1 Tax=Cordyceps militaris (strain CM01) TaxID=983644 RepID=G3JLV4_CORMM|nr:uncharacterized protein CCM_07098 [Cordyceps militaris CM01]EGX90678.1 hypothetical protein CCM_07098 [Cordyceps militaris CM01]